MTEIAETEQADAQADAQADEAVVIDPSFVAPRSYRHISKAINERPWAIQPVMLSFMADMVRFRSEGGVLSEDEVLERLAAAQAANGDRAGGALAGGVAIIPLYGVISQRQSLMSETSGGTSVEQLQGSLRSALADQKVAAVVFDIDSPGGSVDGITEFAAELRAARSGGKPIVAQVNTLAASAAYWLASQMDEIVVTPSGEVGSIGVFAIHEDISGAEEKAGLKTTLISAGEFKTEGNPYEPLADAARAAMQDQVDTFYGMFTGDVAKGRQVPIAQVKADYGKGRTLLAKAALAAGMVDRIDTLEATVQRLQPKAKPAALRPAALLVPAAIAASSRRTLQPDRAWNQRMREILR